MSNYWQRVAERQEILLENSWKVINWTTTMACLFLIWAAVATYIALLEAIL